MVSAEIAMAMPVPIENPADCEVRGVIPFLQADEILGYLAEEVTSRVELFCCTTVHVRILPGRHKPCCVISSSILRTVRSSHRRTFSCFQKMKEHLTGKRFANKEDLKNAVDGHMVWRGCTQTGARYDKCLMSKAIMCNRRQRYVTKLVYSVSVLLIKNILVW